MKKYNVVCESNNKERILEDCHNIPLVIAEQYLFDKYNSVLCMVCDSISEFEEGVGLPYFFVVVSGVRFTYKIVESTGSKNANEEFHELIKTNRIVKKHLYSYSKN